MMSSLFRKFMWWAQRRRKEEELREELQFHLEEETHERQADGLAEDQARWAAHRDLGNVTLLREDARMLWIPVWWDHLLQDTRYGLRLCRRTPGFTVVVGLTLALGIGLNTAVFSVINSVLLKALPYHEPQSIVLVWGEDKAAGSSRGQMSATDIADYRARNHVFDEISTYADFRPIFAGNGDPERVPGANSPTGRA